MNKILKQVDDGDSRIITVCAWCSPGDSIFEEYPQLKGIVQISHGICADHYHEQIRALNSLVPKGER
jgi:hypothetical protein